MEFKKSYYAVLPANVRYDKDLTPNAKLLYAEITCLCNQTGYCWSTNRYFAELYNVSNVSISKWINQLIEKGYINSTFEYKEGTKQIFKRYLSLVNDPIKEKFNTPQTKVNDPIKEKFKDNTTSINNKKNNNKKNNKISFDDFWDLYDKKVGNKDKIAEKWEKLTEADRRAIMLYVPKYKQAQPDKQYRKNPETFLNNKSWNDELIGLANNRKVQLNFD